MVSEDLLTYVKQNLQAGYTSDVLHKALVDQGWNPEDVDEALRIAQTPQQVTALKSSPKPVEQATRIDRAKPKPAWVVHLLRVLGILLILCGIGGVVFWLAIR